jgi:hypothetical protein
LRPATKADDFLKKAKNQSIENTNERKINIKIKYFTSEECRKFFSLNITHQLHGVLLSLFCRPALAQALPHCFSHPAVHGQQNPRLAQSVDVERPNALGLHFWP